MPEQSPPTGADQAPATVHDLVGVGFGPSNLALAIALQEQAAAGRPLDVRFLERQTAFGWHRGMLLADARMQVNYLKDLVTLRNPRSPFGFLSYLHERGRLADFINYGTAFPSRLEFRDYLEWAAARFADQVSYGTQVTGLSQVVDRPDLIRVDTADGRVLHARAVALATGIVPHLPEGIATGPRVWHSNDLLHRLAGHAGARRVVVVGAGQSGAETVEHVHGAFPDAEIHAVLPRYGYCPADDSPFVNRVFDPAAVDEFYDAPQQAKDLILTRHANTNYAAVDLDLIESLYRRHYLEKVTGQARLHFRTVSRVRAVTDTGSGVRVAVQALLPGESEEIDADLVICATGYRLGDPTPMLGGLARFCRRDEAGRLAIGRDYRLLTDDGPSAPIYLQGATEHTHGLSSTLLSTVAVRGGEIAASLAAALGPARPTDLDLTSPLVSAGAGA